MKSQTKRNGLIELYRFILAINVIKSHGMLPYDGEYFGTGKLSVEFFFILSGYLLMRSIDKYSDKPLLLGTWKFLISKLKPLAIPLIIALPFQMLYEYFEADGSFNMWGYLWYIRVMFEMFIIYYVIRRLLKNERIFVCVVGAVFIVASVLHVFPSFYSWGIIRGASTVSLGMLLSYVPKLQVKRTHLLWLILIPIQAACAYMIVFDCNLLFEELLDLVLYPALIYISFLIPVHSPILSYLGSLSFGLYAFQCVPRPFREIGIMTNTWLIFILIVALSVAEDLARRIYKHIKFKSNHNQI